MMYRSINFLNGISRSQRRLFGTLLCVISQLLIVFPAYALSITPTVIDKKGYIRDEFKEFIVLKNDTAGVQPVYISVYNIDKENGAREFPNPTAADLSTSLANWIEVTRGVQELRPGEERRIPLVVRIDMTAHPGIYHAQLLFATGSTRAEAEANMDGTNAVTVNLEVEESVTERLQLKKFVPSRKFSGSLVSFFYTIENIGTAAERPDGEIRIYNGRGEEVGKTDVGGGKERIEPDGSKQMASIWKSSGFGRYKAMLDVRYGDKHPGVLQDTVYFWVLPLPQILALFGVLAACVVAFTIFFHKRHVARNDRLLYAYEEVAPPRGWIDEEVPAAAPIKSKTVARGVHRPHQKVVDLRKK